MRIEKQESSEPSEGKRQRGHIYGQVLYYMRRGLMVGAFLPGQVMSLRKLAAGFGTSPMPVREVLSRLVAANALEETKGGSVRVPHLGPEKLSDLFAVRELLEGMATEIAAKNATPELISSLMETNGHLLTAIKERDILHCLSYNQKFHFTLYEASGSEVLMPLIESLWLQFGPTMYMSLLIPSRPWDASDHAVILQALKDGNVAAAKRSIVHDIRKTAKGLLSVSETHGNALPFAQNSGLIFDF